jgi:hypothetical protein
VAVSRCPVVEKVRSGSDPRSRLQNLDDRCLSQDCALSTIGTEVRRSGAAREGFTGLQRNIYSVFSASSFVLVSGVMACRKGLVGGGGPMSLATHE